MKHPIYLTYGVLLLALTAFAEYRGWSLFSVNEVKNVPKTIRDNPGAYRSFYRGSGRYFGGK
ncbi:MAG: hypothetical protein HY236_12790 [Acidobacteria bacterium]|nr:hypothetical protein [Acidobacteriota bacterium]